MADDSYSRQRIPFSRSNFPGRVIESVELLQNVSSSAPGTRDVYSWGTLSRYVQGPPAPESRPQVTGYSNYEVMSPVQRSQGQESQSNEPTVSLKVIRRSTPNLARLQRLTEEERETQLQESRTAFEEEYVTMTDPTLQRLLALCVPLLNVDVDLERKYKHLDIWRVFEANNEKPRFLHLTQGLGILEKYASNLMKEARPPYWRTVKFTSSLVQIHVGSLIGSRDILSQMGYTQDIDEGVSFPPNVTEPEVQKLRELAPDLFFARYEIDALLVNSHPFYKVEPPVPESEVQLPTLLRTTFPPSRPQRFPPRTSSTPSSGPQQATAVTAGSTTTVVTSPVRTFLPYIQGNQPQQRTPSPIPAARRQGGNLSDRKGNNETQQTTAERNAESEGDSEYEDAEDGILSSNADPNAQPQTNFECRICGESVASKFCKDCKDTFCVPCDEVYHKHRSRLSHVRTDLAMPTMAASKESREVRTASTAATAVTGVVLGTIAAVVAAGAGASSGQQTTGANSSVEAGSVTSGSKDSRPRPVPAPRRNKTPLPSNQGAALSAQAPDPLSPRAPPTTSQRQQTTAFNPAQSPASPRMPGVSQPVATTVTGQVQNQRREIRRPPPFAAHYNSTVTSQRGMDEIDNKPVVKSPPALPTRPTKIPVESKGLTPTSSTTVETGPALSCPNCFCLNPGGAKTCQACKKPLSMTAQQHASGQTVSQAQQTQGNNYVAASSGVAVDPDKWECEYCTYHNPISRSICEVCCKTRSKYPQPTGNSEFGGVVQGTSRETQHSEQQAIPSQNVTNMAMHVNSQQMQSTSPLNKRADQQNFQTAPVWSPPAQTAAAPPLRSAFPAQGNQQPGMWAATVTSPSGQPFSRSFAAGGIVAQGGMTNTHGMVNPQMPGRSAFPGVTSYGYGGMTVTGGFTRDAGYLFGPQGFPPPPPPPPAMGSTSPEVPSTVSFPSSTGSSYQQHQQQVSPGFPPPPPVVAWTERSDEALRRHQEDIYVSGLHYVEWLKKGEKEGFSAEEVNIASVLGIDDSQGPIHWLQTSWYDLIHRVMTEVAIPENSQEIGNVSPEEVREALIECTGEVSRAKAKCMEIRKKKVRELQQEGVYAKTDCISALDSSDGDTQKAILSLEKMAMGPLLRRVLDSCLPDHATQEEIAMALMRQTDHLSHHDKANFEAIVKDKNQNMDRRIRAILAEKDLVSWGRAETAIKLIDMEFSLEDSVEAAKSCGDIKRCLRYLKQGCPLCCTEYPMSQMVTLLHCQDRVCRNCVSQYITITIKDKNILHLVCPCCGEPGNLDDEAVATEYFNNFDILIRGLVDKETHDLFQRKLRDRTLMKEPNFRWCSHCSSGFINEQPGQIKMMCLHCQQYTCFKCKRQWEDQHEGITCEQFAAWKEANDPEFQAAGLAAHLKMNGIVCPACKYRYDLSKGGCMHFKCAMCEHEFCSGCYNPFLNNHGQNCRVSEHCTVRGLHAHHPRDCYFYLRDRDPEELQKLLRDNGAVYNTEPPENQGNDDSDDEAAGAAAAAPAHCKVSEQKETVNGLVDGECGDQAPAGYAGLCRKHYTEYLVNLVNDNLLDPADIMSGDDLKRVLQRGFVNPPEKHNRMNDEQYRRLLLQTVKEQLPLPRKPPRKRLLDDDDEVLNQQNNEDNRLIDSDDDVDDDDDDDDLGPEMWAGDVEDYDPWDE